MIERHGRRNRCGIYEKALPSGSPAQMAEGAANAGFDFVELALDESPERLTRLEWTGRERAAVRRDVRHAGAPVETLMLSAHRRHPWGSADPTVRARAAVLARDTIGLAADLGARCVQIAGYFSYYEPATAAARHWFIDGLAAAAEYAAEHGVVLALENMDGTDVVTAQDALAIVREVPEVRLYPDVGNLAGNGLPVVEELATTLPHAHAIQFKDARPGEFRRVPFGEGTVPFQEVLEFLSDVGYTGPVSVEMWNDEGEPELAGKALSWFESLQLEITAARAGHGDGCGCGH